MSQQSPQPTNQPNILGTLINLLGVMSVFFYFIGWIYRWAYFGFFQLEVTTLDLPLESFFIVPLQVFLGDVSAFSKTLLAVVAAVLLIRLTLWLLPTTSSSSSRSAQNIQSSLLARKLRSFANIVPQPLLHEIVIVVSLLIIVFWLARWQGSADAQRDAVNDTSTRPVVTLVIKEDSLGLGRKLDNLTDKPSLKGYRIIGDQGLFDQLQGRETNDTANSAEPIVWRLLIERNGWIYLFKTLPTKAPNNQRPYVMVVRESDSGDQLLILSP